MCRVYGSERLQGCFRGCRDAVVDADRYNTDVDNDVTMTSLVPHGHVLVAKCFRHFVIKQRATMIRDTIR